LNTPFDCVGLMQPQLLGKDSIKK